MAEPSISARYPKIAPMTTIVGVQGEGFALLAADSQITDGDRKIISLSTPKIVKIGKYLLGVSGDCRPGDILTFNWKPPIYTGTDPVAFMGKKVIPSMLEAFKNNGYDHNKEGVSFSYLLAFGGHIFEIADDFSMSQCHNGIYNIGSGGIYAVGYLSGVADAVIKDVKSAKRHALKALEISASLDINTCAPFQVEVQTL